MSPLLGKDCANRPNRTGKSANATVVPAGRGSLPLVEPEVRLRCRLTYLLVGRLTPCELLVTH